MLTHRFTRTDLKELRSKGNVYSLSSALDLALAEDVSLDVSVFASVSGSEDEDGSDSSIAASVSRISLRAASALLGVRQAITTVPPLLASSRAVWYLYQLIVDLGVISMMLLCNANVIIVYGRRKPGLPSAPLDVDYDNNRTEQSNSPLIINNQSSDI